VIVHCAPARRFASSNVVGSSGSCVPSGTYSFPSGVMLIDPGRVYGTLGLGQARPARWL
jgi:hypothetical protein